MPTGYSFNLDGTAIYLTMASLFVANAMGTPLDLGAQEAGLHDHRLQGCRRVTGAGLATLAAGLQAHKPELLGGVGMIVGIDRFMSEARALTNFTGNAVANRHRHLGEGDRRRPGHQALSGKLPFDEQTMIAGHRPHRARSLETEARVPPLSRPAPHCGIQYSTAAPAAMAAGRFVL